MKTSLKPALIFLSLAIGLASCQRSSKVDSSASATNNPPAAPADSTQPAKWPVPEAMMVHMRNLEQDVKAMEAADPKDHAALAAKIDSHTKQVIAACTMEGKAHDTLHDWLMPFLQLNKEYAAATDAETQSAKFKAIQNSLDEFHKRFE